MCPFKFDKIILVILLFVSKGGWAKPSVSLKADQYILTSAQDEESKHWAKYAFDHFDSRTAQEGIVDFENEQILSTDSPDTQIIHFEFSSDLGDDYCLKQDKRTLYIQIRNNQTAFWLIYQFIKSIAQEDNRFTADDLPPTLIDFKEGCQTFDFAYREPYFAPNLKPDYAAIIGTNSVDMGWGIWGHNLNHAITDTTNDEIYALVDGERRKDQFNFSSHKLYEEITDYILDNFGEGTEEPYKFMIAPEDNDLVSMDTQSVKLGNTKHNATPAVVHLLKKLAERFPNHRFFTTGYKTTKSPPEENLPKNAGVFLSTIDLPKGIPLELRQPNTKEFIDKMKGWREKTPNIFIWDYAGNFDDYLTPIPILKSLQSQLRFFKKHDVKGVFLNASGYDYAPFDDLHTHVAAALMMDVDRDVEALTAKHLQQNYPESHNLLIEYYYNLEKNFAAQERPYPIYGGADDILKTYLNKERFLSFYEALEEEIPKTGGTEKQRLQKLYTALSFTRLQLAYQGSDSIGFAVKKDSLMQVKPDVKNIVVNLKKYTDYSNLKRYKEEDGAVEDYIKIWEDLIENQPYKNILIGVSLNILEDKEEPLAQVFMLNDGKLGFPQDYHQGWLIHNGDLDVKFSLNNNHKNKEVNLRFLKDEKHNIHPPHEIKVKIDNQTVKTISADNFENHKKIVLTKFKMDFPKTKPIVFHFAGTNQTGGKLALDELQIK